MRIERVNNFDLLRLAAAAVVMAVHMISGLHFPYTPHPGLVVTILENINRIFPGVPVFFIISGFLITSSWRTSPQVKRYAISRFLRIYPAYLVCLLVTIGLLFLCGYWQNLPTWDAVSWILVQISTANFEYTPEALKPFSGYMVNGSLWTILMEIEFYVLLPLFLRYRWSRWLLALCAVGSMTAFALDTHHVYYWYLFEQFWWFCLGVGAYLYWPQLHRFVVGKGGWWVLGHLGFFFLFAHAHIFSPGVFDVLKGFTLAGMVLSLAFTGKHLAERILRGNDWSYGLYLYHQPVLHVVYHFFGTGALLAWAGTAVSFMFAGLSWKLIEKPCLQLKHRMGIGPSRTRPGKIEWRRSASPSCVLDWARQRFL